MEPAREQHREGERTDRRNGHARRAKQHEKAGGGPSEHRPNEREPGRRPAPGGFGKREATDRDHSQKRQRCAAPAQRSRERHEFFSGTRASSNVAISR